MVGSHFDTKDIYIEALGKTVHEIILDHSSDPIFCFDRTGKYLYVNYAFSSAFGKDPVDIAGKRIWDIFPGDEGDHRFAAVKKAFDTGEEVTLEVKVNSITHVRYFVTTATPIKDMNSNVQTVICSSKDITNRKQTEDLLQIAKTEAEDRNKELNNLVKELYNKSITDGLTKIFNRQHSMEILEKNIRLARETKCPLSVILFDLDFFKNVNDKYGHIIGDETLYELVQLLNAELDNCVTFGRYGGEEFILILQNYNINRAFELAEHLRKKTDTHIFTTEKFYLSISLGVTEYNNNEDLKQFIKRADDLLYLAKNNGRNRSEFKL
jgi:diguanylate cyclase (GGDEF)-like protein/PAS domain S-box-containing protein